VPANQVPVELLTASGSGLDPHISPCGRVLPARSAWLKARGLESRMMCASLIDAHTEAPIAGILGEERASMCFELNLALDALWHVSNPKG
jgi:K+-transporting ATPase ATPase C chain